ncbi:MAG: hypothetical protein HC804_04720 [Anaerolineae bacterium]|nr:hypothetical protein [Anaerolineae bacterium]
MPIEIGIWKINEKPEKVHFTSLDREARLENILDADISILDPDLMVVGRQVNTDFGNTIDLLAINSQGDLSVIELKRDKTPRDVVAQTLDYASWVLNLNYEDVTTIFALRDPNLKFEQAFSDHFRTTPPERINENHQLIIVASELDSSTERIISYLSSQYGVPINAVFFRYFRQGQDEFFNSYLVN